MKKIYAISLLLFFNIQSVWACGYQGNKCVASSTEDSCCSPCTCITNDKSESGTCGGEGCPDP
jgi:hypothetical protein